MQSLFLQSLISSALPPSRRPGAQQVFTQWSPRQASRWPSFLASVALHLLAVLLVPYLSEQLTSPSDRELWRHQEKLFRTLRIRVPEQLYVAASGPATVPARKTVVYRPAAGEALGGRGGSQEGPQARRGRSPGHRRRFDLPRLPRRASSDQSIVQPTYSADALPQRDLRLPELFFWAPPRAPQALAKPFVLPGHAAPPTQPRVLDAPPALELPYPDPAALTLAGIPRIAERAALFAPPTAMPIRTTYPEQPSQHTGVSADPLPGDPINVLSLSSNPLPLREYLTVPPGNQVGRSPVSESEVRGWASGADHGERGTGANGPSETQGSSATAGGGSSGAGSGAAGSQPSAGELGAGGLGTGGTQVAAGASGTPEGSGGTGASGPVPADTPTPASEIARSPAILATQITHPTNGVFDVVVQSSGFEGFPESAGVLSGTPIYSVYLAVGAGRDWILQYCLPAGEAENPAMVGSVVNLGVPARLTAPYPRTTFRPSVRRRPGGYLMVHGVIDANGRFQDLRVLGTGDPRERAEAIAVLERWEFRPATRQGRPARVEMLLAIPAAE